jgi:rfaE bifunctional protein nucleotidyltransferase chain/domain
MILSRDEAVAFVERLRRRGMTIVFTNGVFDLLHPGHVRYLQDARKLGDALIVGVNSDRSVKALGKGNGRPITSGLERAEVLAALASVDAAVIFDEDTPHAIVSALQPDILVKGADWAEGTIIGADVVEARGGKVVRIALAEGYSTTSLIQKIQSQERSATSGEPFRTNTASPKINR